jgi:hypothetical protein
MSDLVLALVIFGVFVLIIVIMLILRAKVGEKFEVKYSDIAIALIPIVLLLILTDKIELFEFAGIKIKTAIVNASKAEIEKQVLPLEPVIIDKKGPPSEISRLIREKTEALSFQLGYLGYSGPVIKKYLNQLLKHPYLKYIVINSSGGKFFGMADAGEANSFFSISEDMYQNFADWIAMSDENSLLKLPGFISAQDAIRRDSHKQTSLMKMEELKTEKLPVIDEQEKFIGVVDRSRLTASLIIDVANKVK